MTWRGIGHCSRNWGSARGSVVPRGWRFERAPSATLTRVPTLAKAEWRNRHMAIATERQAHVSVTVGGREITFETGKLAKQADGAVIVRSGDTMVLATAQGRMEPREGADFFPLTVDGAAVARRTVDVEERMSAAGKIPGGFFKREGRPSERAILTARMIDRPIR